MIVRYDGVVSSGIRIAELPPSVFNEDLVQSEWYKSCFEFVDGANSSWVGALFDKRGYRSMMAEDWDLGAFNWPHCNGFRHQPTTHYMKWVEMNGHLQ